MPPFSSSRPSTPSLPAHSQPTPSGLPPPDLDPLRHRLVQLIDQLSLLSHHLALLPSLSGAPFADLVQRHALLVTHLSAVQGLLSSQADKDKELERERAEGSAGAQVGRKRRRERERDPKRERWESVSVVPREEVDEANDWIVGMLLRTKQAPEIDASHAFLLSSLPSPFSSPSPSSSGSFTPSPAFSAAQQAHAALLSAAYDKVCALREFNSENEEWEWRARVGLDEEEEEEGEEGEGAGEKAAEKGEAGEGGDGKRAWTPKEVQAFLRTGTRPDL
ncbi:hypothetical protein JCM10207_004131 [Rhodosporidiobolus poonsookiae]